MDYKDRWHIIDELGEGGQGKVSRVYDKDQFDIEDQIPDAILTSIRGFTGTEPAQMKKEHFDALRKALVDLMRMEDPINQSALKELHDHEDAKALARIKEEIEGMSKASHPNLLKILDHDPDSKWFVSQFHPKGTLAKNKDLFTGDFVGSLRAFRHLVEGVSQLHKAGQVHRDIKPENVFLDSNDNLVLGDFGLIFFTDEQHTRISETFEKVGSRDWMAPWAMRAKIDKVTLSSDVFSLGKLLWAMVSNVPFLDFWDFDRPEFNLEEMFPNAPYIELANPLFKKCIVKNPKDCLSDATALLEEVDRTLSIIDRNADFIGEYVERPCKVCGIGIYRLVVDSYDRDKLTGFGFKAVSDQSFKIFTCNHCGNVQLFSFRDDKSPPAWSAPPVP